MDVGLVMQSYHGCWDDAAYAESRGIDTVGFVDSPLIAGDPFVAMALTIQQTSRLRVGPMLAIPSNRIAPALATAVATLNRLGRGRVFLGIGTGFTGRATFGLPPVSIAAFREYIQDCKSLLAGEDATQRDEGRERTIRLVHHGDRFTDPDGIPIYVAADAPKALSVAGAEADGWVTSLQYANVMANAAEVFEHSLVSVRDAAAASGRAGDTPYITWSTGLCVLEENESPTSDRALEFIGAHAMMPFHAYADNPAIREFLPPILSNRLPVYDEGVLDRFPQDRRYLEVHRGHLSHLLPGEAAVLTDDIVRAGTLTGTAAEIAEILVDLENLGLCNVTLNPPPHLVRETVDMFVEKVRPQLAVTRANRQPATSN